MPDAPGPSQEVDAPIDPAGRRGFSKQEIFFGADGLRAGWALLVAAAIGEILLLCLGPMLELLCPGVAGEAMFTRPYPVMVYEALLLFCVLFTTWLMGRVEDRSIVAYGLRLQRGLRLAIGGCGWGLAMLAVLILVLHGTGFMVFDGRALRGWVAVRYGAEWAAGFGLVGVAEEMLFRGYLQFTLTRGLRGMLAWMRVRHRDGLGFWIAAVGLSFAFGVGHRTNPGESPVGLLAAGMIGLVFCLSLWRTGSLWWAIGFHAAWDWGQSFLFGVADSGSVAEQHLFRTRPVGPAIFSGGLTGPEGSILILPLFLLVAAVILLTLPRSDVAYAVEEPAGNALEPPLHLDLQ